MVGLSKDLGDQIGQPVSIPATGDLDEVEYATMEWVPWYKTRRLHGVLDDVPPRNTRPPTALTPTHRRLVDLALIAASRTEVDGHPVRGLVAGTIE
ncbi:hypothetical protein [Mycolicibacterium rhodesiae]|uniref:Uncharacterized protein n=1 Tax=Mycolicibacterium rhodesiae TaxID=36814 RepID=A0A1X0IQ44_MYCRH|nr:hypothetical protein [Mycolicibacterium rhodesiae]MCV7348379.1 hypothetical protein [Mycolicibacterium rhodesiae]ORB50495.1 hypothetical protein BST42_20040 [Mycolicibacterium rhodesiae]